ncbi:MFS transporter [Heliobacterium gestii]|uniref:MFS transporter n=1 Tax=Heliomicrobium gestii TaxID=2699 RepID=A0A845LEJ9_HELGE|nr:MFS transporter [Heliomicrobium gestii]MBM7867249.1 MFS family permease [Heliomicrobium gestii]MZP43804.1 MFS transporter [Heliomicrobium gestii]
MNNLTGRITATFPALRHKNFRYFWFGQCISLLGTWMQRAAQQWLVYTLTKSAFLLGILGVGQFGPMLLFSLFAGVLIDRYPKKRILMMTQTALMIQALILAYLVYSGGVSYWKVLLLATSLGLVNTLDMPARQSFIIELVGRQDLTNAIALNSTIVNLARIAGPSLAAFLMANYGADFCFFINGVSFVPVIWGLYLTQPLAGVREKKQKKIFAEILEGLRYIAANPLILRAIVAMLAVGTFAMNMDVMIPVFADVVLGQGVHGYGVLLSAAGAGSLAASVLLAAKLRNKPSEKLIFFSALIISLFLVILNFIHSYFFAALVVVIVGFFNMIFMTSVNSTIQLNSDDIYRGRAMSIYTLAFAGTTPVGNFFAGAITHRFGPGAGFLMCGLVTGFFIAVIVAMILISRRAKQKRMLQGP